jgi:transposase
VRNSYAIGSPTLACPPWTGGHFPLWGKSLPLARKPRLSAVPGASAPNPSVCPATRTARQNRQTGCHDHRSPAAQWRGAPGYGPSDLMATSRELVRLHSQLSDEVARYKNEIHALLSVLFPELRQIFSDPCRPTAVGILKRYPNAQAVAAAGVEAITALFHELAPRHYGPKTAQQLVKLAQTSTSAALALSARSRSLKILCDQLEHTQSHLAHLEEAIEKLLAADPGATGLQSVPEFGRQTVAVLRAELGEVSRFGRADQVVAYAGLDLQVRKSGKWKGETKLSKPTGCATR